MELEAATSECRGRDPRLAVPPAGAIDVGVVGLRSVCVEIQTRTKYGGGWYTVGRTLEDVR